MRHSGLLSHFFSPPCRNAAWRYLCCALFSLYALSHSTPLRAEVEMAPSPEVARKVRIILSHSALTNTNVNDATAAFKVWMQELSSTVDIPVDQSAKIISTTADMMREMERLPNYLISISLPEYADFPTTAFEDLIFLSEEQGEVGSNYLLLVKNDSPIYEIEDLLGKKVIRYDHRLASTSGAWLGYLLAKSGKPPPDSYLHSYRQEKDLSRSILPVFFGQADACLVTENGFELMGELNPQIRLKLRVIARSPHTLTAAMLMQAGYDESLRDMLVDSIYHLSAEPSGKQVLTLFRADRIVLAKKQQLEDSMKLYRSWLDAVHGDG